MQTKSSKILNLIIITYPLLDIIYSINYLILKVNLPINQVIRTIIMGYLFTKIKRKRSFLVISIIFCLLTLGELSYYYFDQNIKLRDDLAYIVKLIFFVAVVYAFEDMIKHKLISAKKLIKLMVLSSYVIGFSIVLSAFGFGFQSWDSGLRSGFKGLFAVQNTVTATLLVIFPLSLYMFYETKQKRYVVNYLFLFFTLMLIGTKSGLVGSILIFTVQLLMLLYKTKLSYLKVTITVFSILIVLLAAILSKNYFISFIDQQTSLYQKFQYTNAYSFLLSNRDLQINYIKDYIEFNHSFNPSFIFGLGYSKVNEIIHSGKEDFMAIEMDVYGIYYYSGIWVLLIIMLIIFRRYISAVKLLFKTRFNFKNASIFLSLTVGLGHAIYGGHVLYEALTILYIGIVLSIAKTEWLLRRSV